MTATTGMWRLGHWQPESTRRGGEKEVAQWQRERALGLTAGLPFLLRPDGSPDIDVLAFCASPTFKLLTEQTRESYAKDLRLFLSFLDSQSIDWREATWSDLLDYEHWRRRDPSNPYAISGAKMARELAACRKFYDWQQARGLLTQTPFTTNFTANGVELSRLQTKDARRTRVKWLTPRAYRQWLHVGLEGALPDSRLDPSWRGRSEGRNAALAELLWTSGLRLREAGTLLLDELPSPDPTSQYLRARVGQSVAKGRGRDFWMSSAARQQIESYCRSTRAMLVARAQAAGTYTAMPSAIIATHKPGNRLTLVETDTSAVREVTFDQLTTGERRRLLIEGPQGLEPAMLFLTETGLPLRYESWEAVFKQASLRCQRLAVPVTCHPHMLRHSFALRMLVTLIHAFDRRLGLSEDERKDYRLLFGDPWVLVQTLLGHAHPDTTRDVYLEPVQGLQLELFLNADDAEREYPQMLSEHLAATGLVAMGGDA